MIVVTLIRSERVLEDVVERLTAPANPLRLLSESVTVAGEPCWIVKLAIDTARLKSLTEICTGNEWLSDPLVAYTTIV